MDMTLRSFVFAGAVLAVLAAGVAGWWLFDRFGPGPDADPSGGQVTINNGYDDNGYDDREGSVFDEFGQSSSGGGRISITTGDDLLGDSVFDRRERSGSSPGRFDGGPRFDWSGSRSREPGGDAAPLPRDTPAERVEADCRYRGGGAYACRCLVRVARRDLSEPAFEFLSLAEEPAPRAERLARSGLEASQISAVSAQLIALDAQSQRRCGAGLTP